MSIKLEEQVNMKHLNPRSCEARRNIIIFLKHLRQKQLICLFFIPINMRKFERKLNCVVRIWVYSLLRKMIVF